MKISIPNFSRRNKKKIEQDEERTWVASKTRLAYSKSCDWNFDATTHNEESILAEAICIT